MTAQNLTLPCSQCLGKSGEDKRHICLLCNSTGSIPVEILNAMEIRNSIENHLKKCTIGKCGTYCEIDEKFIKLSDVQKIIEALEDKQEEQ